MHFIEFFKPYKENLLSTAAKLDWTELDKFKLRIPQVPKLRFSSMVKALIQNQQFDLLFVLHGLYVSGLAQLWYDRLLVICKASIFILVQTIEPAWLSTTLTIAAFLCHLRYPFCLVKLGTKSKRRTLMIKGRLNISTRVKSLNLGFFLILSWVFHFKIYSYFTWAWALLHKVNDNQGHKDKNQYCNCSWCGWLDKRDSQVFPRRFPTHSPAWTWLPILSRWDSTLKKG